MKRHRHALCLFSLFAFFVIPTAAQTETEIRKDETKTDVRSGETAKVCACPKEGEWKAQNLKGWMKCLGPIEVKRTLGEVKDEGTVWILENNCSSLFGEASRKKDEDVLMERVEDDCGFAGRINGEEDGVKMVIDVLWTIENDEFIKGEMHSEPSLQGMFCEYWRPFELSYDKPIPPDEYEDRKKKMEKKLEKVRENQ